MDTPGAGQTSPGVTVRFAEPLRFFLSLRHRGGVATVRPDGTSTLGHVVSSLGPPLTEVGALMLDGRPVTPAYRPLPGDVVDVEPVRRPQPAPTDPPRFVLDVHLGTLARRLRLLGADVAYRNDASDDELAAQASAESRILLTQDRGLLRRGAVRHGAFVRGSRPDDQLRDVLDRFALTPTPFSRCLTCNGRLEPVRKADVAEHLRPGTRRSYDDFSRCRSCGQVFWRGAHAQRLEALVAGHSARPPASGSDSR